MEDINFTEEFLKLLTQTGLTKKELAAKLNIPIRTIYNWTSSRLLPNPCARTLVLEQLQLMVTTSVDVDVTLVDNDTFFDRISEMKNQLNLSMLELSKVINAPYVTVQKWFYRTSVPPAWVASLLIKKLERMVVERANEMLNSVCEK